MSDKISHSAILESLTKTAVDRMLDSKLTSKEDALLRILPLRKALMDNPKFKSMLGAVYKDFAKTFKGEDEITKLAEVFATLLTGITMGIHLSEAVLEEQREKV